jgi:hydrogenase nickel incorporation protein HypA/HybF
MHELGITRNIVSIVCDAANGRRVTRVTVDVGKLSGVIADALAFCFDVVAKAPQLRAPNSIFARSRAAPVARPAAQNS